MLDWIFLRQQSLDGPGAGKFGQHCGALFKNGTSARCPATTSGRTARDRASTRRVPTASSCCFRGELPNIPRPRSKMLTEFGPSIQFPIGRLPWRDATTASCPAAERAGRSPARPPMAGRERWAWMRNGRTASSSRTRTATSSSAGRSGTRSCSGRTSSRSIPTIRKTRLDRRRSHGRHL